MIEGIPYPEDLTAFPQIMIWYGEFKSPLWCRKDKKEGEFRRYMVINGLWSLNVNPLTGEVKSQYLKDCEAQVVWWGSADFSDREYNEAINHIEALVEERWWEKPEGYKPTTVSLRWRRDELSFPSDSPPPA